MIDQADQDFLVALFDAAIAAADAKMALSRHLPEKPAGRTVVVGAGKGSAQMAAALEELWDGPLEGVVVTRYGYGAETSQITVLEASHPVPDAAGLAASKALFDAVGELTEDDLVIALICGGGSALLPSPPDGLTLDDEVALNEALLASGAPIAAMNAIRKQLSGIKGGRLAAAAYPAPVVSLVVSDVPGDDPAQVASGPTVPDFTDAKTALEQIRVHAIKLPPHLISHIERNSSPALSPSDAVFAHNTVAVVASASISLEAAAREAERRGVPAVILSDAIEGEARDVGAVHAAIAREVAVRGRPFVAPVVILSGGETTVTIDEKGGKGGRNTEFLLSLAQGIQGLDVVALAADTDGIDGSEDNAGAFADGTTWSRIRLTGLDPADALGRHDAWTAFDAAGDIFAPGPTGTNVNDLRAILVRSAS